MDPFAFMGLCLLSILLGTFTGIFSGLIPGIHTNTVAAILVVFHGPMALGLTTLLGDGSFPEAESALICYLVAVAMAHIFVSYIPATFLGAPEEGTALSVLPGHRMLLQGRGMVSIKLSAQGGLAAVLLCVVAVPFLRFTMGPPIDIYDRTRPYIPLLLMLVVLLMVLTEGRPDKRRDGGREPATCLLVDEVRFEGTSASARAPFFEVWALWGLQGRYVLTTGTIVRQGEKISLKNREQVELLFRDRTLRRAIIAHIGSSVSVEGKVCRKIERPRHDGLRRMAWAVALFSMSGALGLVLLDAPGLANMNIIPTAMLGLPPWGWQFMPLFTGLFGLPTLLISLSSTHAIPPQLRDIAERISRKRKARGLLFGTITGTLLGWFPGMTSGTAALLASQASADAKTGEDEEDGGAATEEFMVSVSAINTAHAVANFVALFVILKTRSGAAKAAQDILGDALVPWTAVWPPPGQLAMMLVAVLVSSVLAYFMTLRLGRFFATNFHRVPYRWLVGSVCLLLIVLVLIFSGPLGLAIMVVATFLGSIPPTVGVRRVHLIGCLIVPIFASWAAGLIGWGSLI